MIALWKGAARVIVPTGRPWVIHEYCAYTVRGAESADWDGVPLARDASGAFILQVDAATGRHRLTCRSAGRSVEVMVDVRPNPAKLSPDDWLQMVTELEVWLPTLSAGVAGGRFGGLTAGHVAPGWLVEALVPLVDSLISSVSTLADRLRMRPTSRVEFRPVWSAHTAHSETLGWLGRHPLAASWVSDAVGTATAGPPPRIPARSIGSNVDHVANRAIRWWLNRVIHSLVSGAALLDAASTDCREWCSSRAAALREAARRLRDVVGRTALADLRPEAPADSATAVLVDDPYYARVISLARPFSGLSLVLQEASGGIVLRPTYGLYELWCLAVVAKGFVDRYPTVAWTIHGVESLLNPGDTGGGFVMRGTSSAGALEVRFNATFRSFHTRHKGRFSLSKERRPDLVVGYRAADGRVAWCFLDAKYRVGQNLVDAFESVHVYRDSLRWDEFGGEPEGGVLLSPAQTDQTRVYFSSKYRNDHRIGAIELRPGVATGAPADWILQLLTGLRPSPTRCMRGAAPLPARG